MALIISQILFFFSIDVYPVTFVVCACQIFEFSNWRISVAKGSVSGNGSNDSRTSELEEWTLLIYASFLPSKILSQRFSDVKKLKKLIINFAFRDFGIESFNGTSISSISLPSWRCA